MIVEQTEIDGVKYAAEFSPDYRRRYRLMRDWDAALPRLVFWMLNPSTASGLVDDPTIRRCMGFARGFGYGGILVINVFSHRSPNPKDLIGVLDQPDMANHKIIYDTVLHHPKIVCAWGANALVTNRLWEIDVNRTLFGYPSLRNPHLAMNMYCLGKTKAGAPRHPLYLPSNTPLEAYNLFP